MTATTHTAPATDVTERPVASLGELQRAWDAVKSGRFRSNAQPATSRASTARTAAATSAREWFPTETVIPIIGAGGSVGATTLALALASASRVPARVVECCSASASGLASASTAELGPTGDGWRRGMRDGLHHRILLERAEHPITTAAAVPLPTDPDRPIAITYLDCGWDLDHLLAGGWIAEVITTAPALVVAATATVPGMRRLEVALEVLQAAQVTAAVLGPRRKKWGRPVEGCLGPATRALDAVDGLVEIPLDRDLGIHGPTSTPLPQQLLNAAAQLLDRLPGAATALDAPKRGVDHEPLVVEDDQDR